MADTIIIKRPQKRKHKAKSGGAWKVAFADFMLALMALFMVLWVLAVSDQNERVEFSQNIRGYSIFDGEDNPFDLSGKPNPVSIENDISTLDSKHKVDLKMKSISRKTARSLNPHREGQSDESGYDDRSLLDAQLKGHLETPDQLELLASKLESIAGKIGAIDNIEVEVVPQGLRILLRDDDKHKMFQRGSAEMTPFFQDVLRSLAPVFIPIKNRIMISGHTDAAPFYNAAFTNWELSSQRALQARQMLVIGGMPNDRVAQVVAMSDTMLINKKNPKSSDNRRIELLLLTKKAEDAMKLLFSRQASDNVIDKAFQKAQYNQPVLRSTVLLSEKDK